MELDDLRRQWRQPEAVEVPPGRPPLKFLPHRRSGSPVALMRRNARWEVSLIAVCLLSSFAALLHTTDVYVRSMSVWLISLCVLGGFYFRRKLAILASLSDTAQSLRGYVGQQLRSLRSLVALYYRATMWSMLPSLGIGLVCTAIRLVHRLSGPRLALWLGVLLLCYAVGSVFAYLLTRAVTRWYLQRLYGRHLDHLESQLRELDEVAA